MLLVSQSGIIGKTKNAKIANRFDNKNTKRKLSI